MGLQKSLRKLRSHLAHTKAYLRARGKVISVHTPDDSAEEPGSVRFTADRRFDTDPEARAQLIDLRRVLDRLPPQTREVLGRRFDLDGTGREKLDAIAKTMGISRQRVQQIEVRGLKLARELLANQEEDMT